MTSHEITWILAISGDDSGPVDHWNATSVFHALYSHPLGATQAEAARSGGAGEETGALGAGASAAGARPRAPAPVEGLDVGRQLKEVESASRFHQFSSCFRMFSNGFRWLLKAIEAFGPRFRP